MWGACRWVRVVVAVPRVSVFYEQAKVTHEVVIGSVDKKQVETMISCGPDESEAVDVIVRGLLNALYRPRYISYKVYRDCRMGFSCSKSESTC